jgi:nuclear pore complex protein Nup205
MILRNDADEMSLLVLDEIHLLVYLCTAVFPSVPKSELVSKSTIFCSSHHVDDLLRVLGAAVTGASTQQF